MNIKYRDGGRMEQGGGKGPETFAGQFASAVMSDEKGEYIFLNNRNMDLDVNSPAEEWMSDPNTMKIYGNWNEYAQGQDDQGNMFLPDEDFPIMQDAQGNMLLDERRYEDSNSAFTESQGGRRMASEATGGPSASPVEDLLERLGQAPSPTKFMMGGEYGDGGKMKARKMAAKATGGQGALPIEDLLERLSDYGRRR